MRTTIGELYNNQPAVTPTPKSTESPIITPPGGVDEGGNIVADVVTPKKAPIHNTAENHPALRATKKKMDEMDAMSNIPSGNYVGMDMENNNQQN